MSNDNETRMTRDDAWEIGRLDAHDQAALLRSGEVSALELTEAAIVRIEQLEPALNAVTHRAFESARARGAVSAGTSGLAGVPYLLKDSLDYPGMPSRCGSRSRADAPNVTTEYEYTRRLDASGLIPLGKTGVPEFSLLPTTESVLVGPARNPWSLAHSPGGSSGGAAVAVASGMVPLAHAADGGGSIRIPASCCGVIGLKPGRGGNVRARAHHVIDDFLVGDILLSRTVRDAEWAFRAAQPGATADSRPTNKRLRVALVMNNLFGDASHPEVSRVIRKTADLCANLGHAVEETTLPIDGPAISASFRTLWGYVAAGIIESTKGDARGRRLEEILEPWTLGLARFSEQLGGADLESVFAQVAASSAAFSSFFQSYDVFLSPVLKTPPVEIGQLAPTRPFDELLHDMFEYVSYSPLQNLTGLPAMSVPLFVSGAGLPIGSMFTAARDAETTLLRLAYELEEASPWAQRWPRLSVP